MVQNIVESDIRIVVGAFDQDHFGVSRRRDFRDLSSDSIEVLFNHRMKADLLKFVGEISPSDSGKLDSVDSWRRRQTTRLTRKGR